MKPDQQKYLFSRLNDAQPSRHDFKDLKRPRKVVEAQRVVARWERSRQRRRDGWYRVQRKAYGKVQEVIYAGDYGKALAAVKAFEKEHVK